MFYIRLFEDDGRKYGFERFSYLKSYNENSKVTIEGFYKLSGSSSGESGSGSAGTLAMNKADGSLSPSVVGLEKGKKVSVELIYHFAQIGIKDHAKKSVAVNEEQNSVLLKFTGIVQSVSSKSQISGKRMHSVALTSDFANMSGTTNEIFHPKNGENKDGGAEGGGAEGGKQDNTFSLSKVVNGPMSKYMADSENGGSEVTLASDFADASTSSGIFSLSDSKNLAYDISKDYGFSIYDTQRKEGDKWKTDSVVEIKRIGRGEKSETISLSDQNEGDSSLVVNAVRQIARNNVVYDGIATLNPIAYYKDMATVDDAKSWGKQMSVINQAQEGGNPIDSNGGNALPTMADPFGFCEDGADADKKIAGRKDYKIFERSEYEMDLSSVPAVVVRNKTDEEDQIRKSKIAKYQKMLVEGINTDPSKLKDIGIRNVGCASCPMKIGHSCSIYSQKHVKQLSNFQNGKLEYVAAQVAHNEFQILQQFVPYRESTLKSISDRASYKSYAKLMNRFFESMLYALRKNIEDEKDCPTKVTEENFEEVIGRVQGIFYHATCATLGWSCPKMCKNGGAGVEPQTIQKIDNQMLGIENAQLPLQDRSKQMKELAAELIKEYGSENYIKHSYYSPYGSHPTSAFCDNMNLEAMGCNNFNGCGRAAGGTGAIDAYNVFMITGRNEATLYAYLVDSPNISTVTFAFNYAGKWTSVQFSGPGALQSLFNPDANGGSAEDKKNREQAIKWIKDRYERRNKEAEKQYDSNYKKAGENLEYAKANYTKLWNRQRQLESEGQFTPALQMDAKVKQAAGAHQAAQSNLDEFGFSSPGYMMVKPRLLSLIDPFTLETVNLLDTCFDSQYANFASNEFDTVYNQRLNAVMNKFNGDWHEYFRDKWCDEHRDKFGAKPKYKSFMDTDDRKKKCDKWVSEQVKSVESMDTDADDPPSYAYPTSFLVKFRKWMKDPNFHLPGPEAQIKAQCKWGEAYRYDDKNGVEGNIGNLFPLKNWGKISQFFDNWNDPKEWNSANPATGKKLWFKMLAKYKKTHGLFRYEANEQKGFKGQPFPGFVNKFFWENRDGFGSHYSDSQMSDHGFMGEPSVMFVLEPITPLVYDLMIATRLQAKYEPDIILKKKEIKEKIEKLKGEEGQTETLSYLKVHTFFDKFPLDYVSFKGNKSGAVPINGHDYIVKEIETTISTADADIKSNLELMANPYLKAKGLAVSEMPKDPNGTTPVAVWGAKDEEAVKNDAKHMLYSDFSGVSIRLRAVPASPDDKGEFVEPGKGMGIGEYAAGPESGAGAKKP